MSMRTIRCPMPRIGHQTQIRDVYGKFMPGGTRDQKVETYLSESEREKLVNVCMAKRITIAEYVRRCVLDSLTG